MTYRWGQSIFGTNIRERWTLSRRIEGMVSEIFATDYSCILHEVLHSQPFSMTCRGDWSASCTDIRELLILSCRNEGIVSEIYFFQLSLWFSHSAGSIAVNISITCRIHRNVSCTDIRKRSTLSCRNEGMVGANFLYINEVDYSRILQEVLHSLLRTHRSLPVLV